VGLKELSRVQIERAPVTLEVQLRLGVVVGEKALPAVTVGQPSPQTRGSYTGPIVSMTCTSPNLS
jgi:hypothetical protein